MLLSAITPQLPLSPPNSSAAQTLPRPPLHLSSNTSPKPPAALPSLKPLNSSSTSTSTSLRHVSSRTLSDDDESQHPEPTLVSSASAVSATIRKASSSPVDFAQRIEKNDHPSRKLIMPSPDFQRLCLEQLDLFRRIVDPDAILSVYVRPAGSYVMDRLELRRVTSYPGVEAADIVILVGNFTVPTGLRAAEAALSSQQVKVVEEHSAVVFPMVKQPFVVGFLVAELPEMEKVPRASEGGDLVAEEPYALSSPSPGLDVKKSWKIQTLEDEPLRKNDIFTAYQRSNAINISRTLAMAYVMDQKAMLLQQSSWQNNVRMGALVEQIRGPLSSIRTLSKMLSTHIKKSEISYDIVEDISVQGDRMRDTLQELQDAVYLTKANIVRYNEETLKKMHNSAHSRPESLRSQLSDDLSGDGLTNRLETSGGLLRTTDEDIEMPMPPLALAPLQKHEIRKTVQCV
ncbi:hypothetical protein DITRI_Ditri12bG0059400 [Diplodiscus trichospermus]